MGDANSDRETIRGWTQEEKYNLIQALKAGGLRNISLIQERVPTKTPEEIIAGLEYYKNIALQHPLLAVPEEQKKPKKKTSHRRRAHNGPIMQWQQQLASAMEPEQLRTDTATAIRMIAESEDIPPKEMTEDIDIREVYHQIANCMEGKPIVADAGTSAVLHKCMIETSIRSKMHLTPEVKDFVKNIEMPDKEGPAFTPPKPTEDAELAALRHLAAQRSYNPLNVPEELLKKPLGPNFKFT
uniref:Myb-like domain-containing protein n=1 Tax=Heliothis virescens TaxID=7102 RepID=A0A2A4JUZ6_HELVI